MNQASEVELNTVACMAGRQPGIALHVLQY